MTWLQEGYWLLRNEVAERMYRRLTGKEKREWPQVYNDLACLMNGSPTQRRLREIYDTEVLSAYLRGENTLEDLEARRSQPVRPLPKARVI